MKKTLIFALAAMSAMAADPILNLTQDDVLAGTYNLAGITNHQYTVAFTLDLALMAQTPGQSPIIALGGMTGTVYGAELIAFDNGGINYATRKKDSMEAAFTFVSSSYNWGSVTDFTSLSETPDWSNAKSAAFVLVGDIANNKDRITGYLFILNNDASSLTYAGTKDWSYNTAIDTLNVYNASSDASQSLTCVDSLQVFTDVMDADAAKNLAMSMMSSNSTPGTDTTVPEPATATLSLLALAGLAARRRRK